MASGLPNDRRTSAIPTSGRTTPIIQAGRITPSLVGHPSQRSSTPSGIPSRSTPSSVTSLRPSGSATGRRETIGLASPLYQSQPIVTFNPLSQSASSSSAQSTRIGLPSPSPTLQQTNFSSLQPIWSPTESSANSSQASSNSTTVQVVLRIRPSAFDSNVPTRFQRTVLSALNSSTVAIENPVQSTSTASSSTPNASQGHKAIQRFTFDRVYSPEEGQESIWGSVESLVSRFLEGYNVTVLAYGQTSSGKSYTMGTDRLSPSDLTDFEADDTLELSSERIGIIPRAVHNIFHRIRQLPPSSNQTTIKTSYVEIYNEDLIDLVASSSSQSTQLPQVTIREDKDGKIIWSGLKEMKVSNASDVLDLLQRGSSARQTNSTEMNAQSSRSHAIFSLSLTQKKPSGGNSLSASLNHSGRRSQVSSPTPGSRAEPSVSSLDSEWVTVTSKFHFVDLAGSERLKRTSAVGERVKEGISINSGLHALGNVISALGDPSKAKTTTHIPYRDSKLTRLLQDSLGGNAHTLMIACVSPIEYNLNETLNTVKYANRARNIKNRAEVNAIEAGWEDVEYLQATVIKLRKELANLKNGLGITDISGQARTLGAIDEEADERAPRFLELQGHLSELQAKYAKTIADLAQAQNNLSLLEGSSRSISQSDFEGMIQPVVEEYEKSITALESQLALTKAALVHSEQSMKELDDKLMHEQMINESNSNVISDLKTRVGRLIEREATNEVYIKDLEEKLRFMSDSDETSSGMVTELKKEIIKLKETEAKSEKYIKDLELKFSKDEEAHSTLKARVDQFEAQLARKEEVIEELQLKYNALSAGAIEDNTGLSDQQKTLIAELDEREEKLRVLEAALKEFQDQKQQIEQQKAQLESAPAASTDTTPQASSAPTASVPVATLSAKATQPASLPDKAAPHRSVSPGSFTPPATPASFSAIASSSRYPTPAKGPAYDDDMKKRFRELQERYELTVSELDQVQTKYNNSLKELDDLSAQLDESRLMQPTPTYHISRTSSTSLAGSTTEQSPLPSPIPSSPGNHHRFPNNNALPVKGFGTPVNKTSQSRSSSPHDEDLQESLQSPDLSMNSPQQLSGSETPVRTLSLGSIAVVGGGVGPRTYRSTQFTNGTSARYMARQSSSSGSITGNNSHHVMQTSQSLHGRSLSLSLSQDISKVIVAGNRATLLVATSPHSPRPISPQTGRVMLGGSETPHLGRSYESLEKEVIQLQEVLKDREEEIRTLEQSIRDLHRQSESLNNARLLGLMDETKRTDETISTLDQRESTASPTSDGMTKESHEGKDSSSSDPHPSSADTLNRIKESFYGRSGSIDSYGTDKRDSLLPVDSCDTSMTDNNSKNIQRLDDLMRSMAQKESAHLELIETLRDQLGVSQKAHDELVKLSRDQVANMSSEIEGLRGKLGEQDGLEAQLNEMEQGLMAKEKELEVVKDEVKRVMLETETNLVNRHEIELESLRASQLSEIERLKGEHKDLLERLVEASEVKLRAKEQELKDLESKWETRLKEELELQASAHQTSLEEVRLVSVREGLEEMKQKHDAELAEIVVQVEAKEVRLSALLTELEAKESGLKAMESDHSSKIQELQLKLEQAMSSNPDQLKSLEAEIEGRLRGEIEKMKASHAQELAQHFAEVEESRSRLAEEQSQTIEELEVAHEQQIEEIRAEHEEILVASLTELDARRTRKFEANLAALQAQHESELQSIQSQQNRQADENETRSGSGSDMKIEQLRLEYEEQIERLKLEHQTTFTFELKNAREADQKRIEQLSTEVRALKEAGSNPSEAETELQEALDALSTLDKALLESQVERERLMKDLKASIVAKEQAQSELGSMKVERDQMAEERDRLAAMKGRMMSDEFEGMTKSRIGGGSVLRSDSPSLVMQRNPHLMMAQNKAPPTPPPTMPPPPLPTTLPPLPSNGRPAERSSNTSSQLSRTNSNSGRESPSTSVGTNSLVESVSMDPRVLKKIEDQENAIAKLSKQLSHCEVDLKSNIDLVANLESALNDTERNLRKSRLQMNELVKERDKLNSMNDQLKQELNRANLEVENVRNNVMAEKVEFENRLGEERRAKESAKKLLEARMEEMQNSRMTRKSKFNCF
ncbi:uncharacterized protein MELLADRAFT_78111 [Melampsora larici-populina 98AG31]|uniref:Kinesin motor domain-containing protein n=1 Tax=Melampsora larici-populina (strain 98AG31 / pathotype 3-4-7) TaxID=747676 RepID=F4RQA2_MELLP|nr:uncharacterized protein MELLADRAFT_78111 [Melampsora larici-populina 98AG31]EGG05370.1 hypothetical protein MELLADRAFT_78111 [Melampsora larici-populina 98AG31]